MTPEEAARQHSRGRDLHCGWCRKLLQASSLMGRPKEIDVAKLEAAANRLRGVALHLGAIMRNRMVVELAEPIAAIEQSVADIDAETDES